MKKLLLYFFLVASAVQLKAQTNPQCAFDTLHEYLLSTDSTYLSRVILQDSLITEFLKTNVRSKASDIITIPVVVHVIHTGQPVGTGANISMAQINSAIDTLTAKYRNMHGESVDTKLEFVLAKRDPNGNPTNGVSRVDGSSVPNYATEGISAGSNSGADEVAVKDLSRWPNTQYYNIWVVTEINDNDGGSGVQGYAYFPGAPVALDGTVIMHTAFGTSGTVNSFNNKNRTLIHELGHGLNLYHTFEGDQGGTTCPTGPGDRVNDTDPHIRANYNCPSGTNPCTGNSIDELAQNYLNYTDQNCAVQFTVGQNRRMQAGLMVGRPSLVTSLGDMPPASDSVEAVNCIPSTSNTNNNFAFGIYEFELNNIDVVSKGTVGEGDFVDQTMHQTISVLAGSTYNIRIQTGPANNENVAVFIDYNNDGDLSDINETVFTSNNMMNHSGSITIPAMGVAQDTLIRLRIISESANNIITGSCYNPQFGQTEDYALYINSGAMLSVTVLVDSNVSCNGGNDGGLSANASNGTSPYTYNWSNGGTGSSITGLSAGTYTVTVTDNNGTTATDSRTVSEPSPLIVNIDSSNVSCSGGNDGSATALASGGTSPYTYEWSNGSSNASISGLSAGTYTVTLTDNNGCTDSESVTITDPTAISLSTSVTDASSNGANDGSIDLTVSGGTTPYTYNWSNGSTTEDINMLSAGTYTVTVTDNNGCTESTSATVNQPGAIAINGTVTDLSCNGNNSGSIDITVSGGTTPYSYNWSNGSTTEDINMLSAGTYTVTVTDNSGATANNSFTVNEPAAISLSTSVTDASSNGANDGSIDLTVSGGTTPYTYNWSNGSTTEDINMLSAGTYTVTVTDNNGCTESTSATVNQPGAIAINGAVTDLSCNGNNSGSIDITVSGGTTPYSYNWSNGSTTEDINMLSAGTYTVTVTDNSGATTNNSFTVNQPAAIGLITNVTNASSNGANDGSIDLTVSSGTTPYSYNWSNGSTTEDISMLSAGTYTVTVTDNGGCTATTSGTVTEPAAITIADTITNVSCNGGNDGAINIGVSGGTTPYSYNWSNGATTEDINMLSAGTYTVTVTDGNGGTATSSSTVMEPVAINLMTTATDASSAMANDGSIDMTVNGGTSPYTYNWSNGATTEDINMLSSGTYTVTVTDANSCTMIASDSVGVNNSPGPLQLVISEIMYNSPILTGDSLEFIEIVNVGNVAVNLNGFTISQAISFTFGNFTINSGQVITLAINSSAFNSTYGSTADFEWTSGDLSDNGEAIVLIDNNGNMIDSVSYSDMGSWPSGSLVGQPDGGGASIELINSALNNNDGSSWIASVSPVTGSVVNGRQLFASPGVVSFAVGLENVASHDFSMKLYPNPSTEFFYFEADLISTDQNVLRIFAASGKLVKQLTITSKREKINTEDLPEGLYIINYNSKTEKLIITN